MKLKQDGRNSEDDNTDVIKLLKNAFAHIIQEAYIHTTGGTGRGNKRFVPQVSTIIRVLTSKNGGFSSYFDQFNEKNINIASFKGILFINDTKQARK